MVIALSVVVLIFFTVFMVVSEDVPKDAKDKSIVLSIVSVILIVLAVLL